MSYFRPGNFKKQPSVKEQRAEYALKLAAANATIGQTREITLSEPIRALYGLQPRCLATLEAASLVFTVKRLDDTLDDTDVSYEVDRNADHGHFASVIAGLWIEHADFVVATALREAGVAPAPKVVTPAPVAMTPVAGRPGLFSTPRADAGRSWTQAFYGFDGPQAAKDFAAEREAALMGYGPSAQVRTGGDGAITVTVSAYHSCD